MFSQLVEICRQLAESHTVIAETRRNIVVNSSELSFNIMSYGSNSSELGFNIVLYRSNSYTTCSNSCYVSVFDKAPRTHEMPRHKYEICTTIYESATRSYDLRSSHFRRRLVARFFNSLKFLKVLRDKLRVMLI